MKASPIGPLVHPVQPVQPVPAGPSHPWPGNQTPVAQGHFGEYSFQLPRSPAPPRLQARQTQAHRHRMPRSARGPHAGGHGEELDLQGPAHSHTGPIDGLDLRASLRTGDTHTGFGQGDDSPADGRWGGARLQARVAPDKGKATAALEKQLLQAQWPGFAVLLAAADEAQAALSQQSQQSAQAHAEALVDALLASLDIDPATASPGMDAQSVQTAAVQAYLRGRSDAHSPPSTLLQIKQLLISRAGLRARPPVATDSEAMQNRRLLLPLLLLNAFARPRTRSQRLDACDRLGLLQGRTSMGWLP